MIMLRSKTADINKDPPIWNTVFLLIPFRKTRILTWCWNVNLQKNTGTQSHSTCLSQHSVSVIRERQVGTRRTENKRDSLNLVCLLRIKFLDPSLLLVSQSRFLKPHSFWSALSVSSTLTVNARGLWGRDCWSTAESSLKGEVRLREGRRYWKRMLVTSPHYQVAPC